MSDITLNVTSDDLNDVVNKADKSLSNLTTEGKSFAASAAAPSTHSISVAIGAAGSTYIAPATGWFAIAAKAKVANTSYLTLEATDTQKIYKVCSGFPSGYSMAVSCFAKKGTVIKYGYGDVTINAASFVYAEGEI